jgi:hypothetical protein
MAAPEGSFLRRLGKWAARLVLALVLILMLGWFAIFHRAVWHRFVTFPREEKAWEELRQQRRDVERTDGWTEYRGVCHSHSHFSHDSTVPFETIVKACKTAGVDFICMTDHCVDGQADYGIQWRGLHDGVLFIPGFEMQDGFMPWGLPSETVLPCGEDPHVLARRIHELGGILFFAHSEEPRIWDLPELNGMEIYNIHTDIKEEGYFTFVPDFILNGSRYGDHAMRLLFDEQTAILKHWDELNQARKIVGIAASDAHQNVGVRLVYTAQGTLRLEDTAEKLLTEIPLNPVTRLFARLCFGPLEPGREVYRLQMDPYERSLRFVGTHILAHELTEAAVLDALKSGRVFIAFDMIVNARGFQFTLGAKDQRAVMGERIANQQGLTAEVRSPVPCTLRLLRNGQEISSGFGDTIQWQIPGAGKYRVEAYLTVTGNLVPWVYTNPIEVY